MRRTLGPVSSSGLNSRPSMGRQSMGLPSKGPQRTSMAMGSSRQSMSARNQSLGRKSTGISRETMARGGSRQDPVSIACVIFQIARGCSQFHPNLSQRETTTFHLVCFFAPPGGRGGEPRQGCYIYIQEYTINATDVAKYLANAPYLLPPPPISPPPAAPSL